MNELKLTELQLRVIELMYKNYLLENMLRVWSPTEVWQRGLDDIKQSSVGRVMKTLYSKGLLDLVQLSTRLRPSKYALTEAGIKFSENTFTSKNK